MKKIGSRRNPDLLGILVNKFWDRLNESNRVNQGMDLVHPDMDQDKGSAWNPTPAEVDGLLADKPSPGPNLGISHIPSIILKPDKYNIMTKAITLSNNPQWDN